MTKTNVKANPSADTYERAVLTHTVRLNGSDVYLVLWKDRLVQCFWHTRISFYRSDGTKAYEVPSHWQEDSAKDHFWKEVAKLEMVSA